MAKYVLIVAVKMFIIEFAMVYLSSSKTIPVRHADTLPNVW